MGRWLSSEFSTTITWNMRGRHRKAAADRNVSPNHRPVLTCHFEIGEASMRARTSPTPSASPQTTKVPTASKAKSLTMASTAIAITTPLCRSLTSRLRVPKIIVKTARPAATQSAMLEMLTMLCASLANTDTDRVTDCNCNAM